MQTTLTTLPVSAGAGPWLCSQWSSEGIFSISSSSDLLRIPLFGGSSLLERASVHCFHAPRMKILPFHCSEISCSNALQHLRGRYFQTGAVPLFVYSYRSAALEDDSSRFERPWNAIVVSLYTLKDEDFSETTVLEQSLECSLRSERPRLSGSNTLKRLLRWLSRLLE